MNIPLEIVNEVNKALHCISYVSECGEGFYSESFICLKTKEQIIQYFIKPEYNNIDELQDMDIEELKQMFYPDIEIMNSEILSKNIESVKNLYDFIIRISGNICVKNCDNCIYGSESLHLGVNINTLQKLVGFINYVNKLKEDGRIHPDTKIITDTQ